MIIIIIIIIIINKIRLTKFEGFFERFSENGICNVDSLKFLTCATKKQISLR